MENVKGENFGEKQIYRTIVDQFAFKMLFVIVIIICSIIDN